MKKFWAFDSVITGCDLLSVLVWFLSTSIGEFFGSIVVGGILGSIGAIACQFLSAFWCDKLDEYFW